jgi:hypothetical protein
MPLADKPQCCLLSVMGLGRTLPVVWLCALAGAYFPMLGLHMVRPKVAWAGLCRLIVLVA